MTPVYKLSANSVKNGRTVYGSMLAGNTGYVIPTAFESIATVSVGSGGATDVEFTSIPSNYTHLQVRAIGRSTKSAASAYINMQFNSDTGSNYTYHAFQGDGTTFDAVGLASQTQTYLQRFTAATADANTFGSFILDILDYKNTNKYKTIRSLGGNDRNGSGQIYFVSGLWLSTNAITSIKFTSEATGNFVQYSHFALYGIKNA